MTRDQMPPVPCTPSPGSGEALAQGCQCPVLDNRHGKTPPCPPGGWWITRGCPLHAPVRQEDIA